METLIWIIGWHIASSVSNLCSAYSRRVYGLDPYTKEEWSLNNAMHFAIWIMGIVITLL